MLKSLIPPTVVCCNYKNSKICLQTFTNDAQTVKKGPHFLMVLMVFTEVTGLREADEFLEMLFEKSPSLSVYWKSREKISQIFRNLSYIALPAVCYSLS